MQQQMAARRQQLDAATSKSKLWTDEASEIREHLDALAIMAWQANPTQPAEAVVKTVEKKFSTFFAARDKRLLSKKAKDKATQVEAPGGSSGATDDLPRARHGLKKPRQQGSGMDKTLRRMGLRGFSATKQ